MAVRGRLVVFSCFTRMWWRDRAWVCWRGPARVRAEQGAAGGGIPGLAPAVSALADRLGVGRFAVLAHPLGSAYALACAPALGDRLAVIVIASGMGPLAPGERFRSGNRDDDLYWRLARRQASWLLNPASAAELDELDAAARAHLENPHTVVISGLLYLTWGRKPDHKQHHFLLASQAAPHTTRPDTR
jgi:pimeloyl-ACP methyl ester carboxylesterase